MLSRDNSSDIAQVANDSSSESVITDINFDTDWKSQAKVLTIGCLLTPVSIAVYAAAIMTFTPLYLLSKYSR